MRRTIYLLGFFLSFLYAVSSYAAAVFELVTGDVRAGPDSGRASAVRKDQRIEAGTVVTTGAKSVALLRFDDGQALALTENSEVKVAEYAYTQADPRRDRSVFDLVKGAMRSVSGALAQRSPAAYALRIPQATIGVRGTDFMVGLVNPAYMQVTQGAIGVTNAAGSATFTAVSTAMVQSSTVLATSIPASALPPSISSAFSQLGAMPIAGVGAGAGGASAAASGGLGAGAIGAIAAAIAAAVAVASQDDSSATPGTTGTTGTTGTK